MKRSLLAALAVLFVTGCSGAGGSTLAPGTISIVTTTTVFADFVSNIGGSHVTVTSLVPKGGDVHTFDPSPSDAVVMTGAKLVVMNGLGLDDWLVPFVQNTGNADIPILRLGEGLAGVDYIAAGAGEAGSDNPHLWMDVQYARKYADAIRAKLDEIDPANRSDYDANAANYDARLVELDQYVRSQIATIPEANRKMVTFHDAFPYYARDYGITIVGVAVPAPGQDPSAGQIADLVNAIKASGVKLVLAEVQFPDNLVREIASDTGARLESDLYDDALTDQITSYDAEIRWDTDRIVEGLR